MHIENSQESVKALLWAPIFMIYWMQRSSDYSHTGHTMKNIVMVAAVLAFIACLAAGIGILYQTGLSFDQESVLVTGIGLYFVGKAIFVGTSLLVSAHGMREQNKTI